MIIKNTKKTWLGANWITDLIFLTIILCAFFMVFLSARPLFAPDEGRYAEIAREMVQSGDYITPHLNYLKYFEKPVLFYWLSALAIKLGGLQILTLRMVNAILGLIGCLVTYAFARTMFNRTTGLLAAGILATSPLYFTMVHTISLDLPVTVFFSFSLYAYLIGQQTSAGSKRCYWFWTASAMAAFAVLTKGLIGIVFPVVIISIWVLMLKDRNVFKHLYLRSCIIIFLLIAAPWHVLVQAHNPEFFNFYFIRQHFLRYTSTTGRPYST